MEEVNENNRYLFLKMGVYFCLCGSSQARIEELEEELEAERAMRAKVQL